MDGSLLKLGITTWLLAASILSALYWHVSARRSLSSAPTKVNEANATAAGFTAVVALLTAASSYSFDWAIALFLFLAGAVQMVTFRYCRSAGNPFK